MPSPFPGMDPFLELQEWDDFHSKFNTAVSDALQPQVAPRYIVRAERRVYVESPGEWDPQFRRPDVSVLWTGDEGGGAAVAAGPALSAEPFECDVPMPEERRETYLLVRLLETMEVVTVLETLSPANKRPSGDGRREYLEKRREVLGSQSHLVELDLLRGGARLPMTTPLPAADYYAIISRRNRRPRATVYAWTLRDAATTIPIPLKKGDADVTLNLQAVLTSVYDRARYDLSLNYAAELQPLLSAEDAEWARELLSAGRQP
jgi:Protein of unknown function (DUF4058)